MAELRADEARLTDEYRVLEQTRLEQLEQMRRLGTEGNVDIDRIAARRFHAARLSVELGALEQKRQVVAEQVKLCRQALRQADQDVKALEKLEEKQRAAFVYERQRREARELEQTWLALRVTEALR
jgi:flagellar export protein FliJ